MIKERTYHEPGNKQQVQVAKMAGARREKRQEQENKMAGANRKHGRSKRDKMT